jgi:hypothetical protein
VIPGFRREVDEICAVLSYYADSSGNFLPMFRDNRSHLQGSGIQLKMGTVGCPETSVRNYHYSLRNKSEERSSHEAIPIRSFGAMILTGKQTCPITISSNINFTWNKLELNPGLYGEKPDTNILTFDTDAVFITCPNSCCVPVSWWMNWCHCMMYFCK